MNMAHKILFIDDDPDDLEFYTDSLRQVDPRIQVDEARTGITALEYLSKAKSANSLPCLIVLDINMPRMGGRETLEEIRKDDILEHIPIVIFSTAGSPKEREYFEGYNVAYFTKPNSFTEMKLIAEKLLRYCA